MLEMIAILTGLAMLFVLTEYLFCDKTYGENPKWKCFKDD